MKENSPQPQHHSEFRRCSSGGEINSETQDKRTARHQYLWNTDYRDYEITGDTLRNTFLPSFLFGSHFSFPTVSEAE